MLTHRNALRGAHIAAHGAAILFGLTGIFGALIDAGAVVITFGRAAFAVAALAAFALAQGKSLLGGLTRARLAVLTASGALLALHWVTFFIAVKSGGVAVATLGFASFPAFIAVLDMLVFRERIGASEGMLLALVTLGLVLVTPSFDFGDRGTVGLAWGVASGLSFAVLAMLNRRGTRGLDAMQVAFWQNLVVAALLAPFALDQAMALRSAADWVYLALLGVFCTGLAQYLFVRSLDGLDARSAGMIIALEPVYAIACAWWLFGEKPSLRMVAGGALIMVAIVLSARGKHTQAQAPAPLM